MDAIRQIRARRAQRQGLIGEGREATYGSALEQFEQLLSAAGQVGYATRPLLLYYALSQAARALAAVRVVDAWSLRGHGLGWRDSKDTDVLVRCVVHKRAKPRPNARDAFDGLSSAIGSPMPSAPMAIGALIAALPEIDVPLRGDAVKPWPRPLEVVFEVEVSDSLLATFRKDVVGYLIGAKATTPAELSDQLKQYPAAAGAVPDSYDHQGEARLVVQHVAKLGRAPTVAWPPACGRFAGPASLDAIAGRYWTGRRLLFPDVGKAGGLSPLAIWFALLYALSMLARYEPAAWRAALDTDQSATAATLEAALNAALEAVPQLVLEALDEDPLRIVTQPLEDGQR
jgi:hypothetical protein